ncbi:techylectin-5A-like [Branchiostoma floridae x Branchiostoma belcheri]
MKEAKDKLAWLQNATGTHGQGDSTVTTTHPPDSRKIQPKMKKGNIGGKSDRCDRKAKVRPTNFTCTSTNFPRYFKSGMNSAAPDGDDCADILQKSGGKAKSGIYVIKPHSSVELHGIRVLCHMEDGRGWTVIQRRRNNRESFYRKWSTYEQGFGHPCGNVWLGNRHIYQLTHQKQYALQIYMMRADGKENFADYDSFLIEGEEENYKLRLGSFSGSCNLRDAMAIHNNTAFSTLDRDNDNYFKHCVNLYKGGWWYNKCFNANLNGVYHNTEMSPKSETLATGILWLEKKSYKQNGLYLVDANPPLKYMEMRIAPKT